MRIIVLDTETLGLNDQRVYDLGYLVFDTETEEVLCKRSYVIKQVFDNEDLMKTAYYNNKRPIYLDRLNSKYSKKVYWGNACRILERDMIRYGVKKVFAYNSRFDYRSILKTCLVYLAKVNPTEKGIDDIMDYISPITDTKEYKEFCEKNGFMTRHHKSRPQKKAETLYSYLTNNVDYKEEHTALEDSKIELSILMTALSLAR